MVALNPYLNVAGDACAFQAEGTEVLEPLVDTPWGARFGVLRDPFGVLWLYNIGG